MMKTKSLRRPLLCFLLLTVAALCGSVLAYMYRVTELTQNAFTPAYVDCIAAETFDGTTKSQITVQNTGNIPAYLRVRLVSYWVYAESGEIAPIASQAPAFTLGPGWVAGSGSTYYYAVPVAAEAITGNLLGGPPLTLEIKTIDSTTYHQVIDVFAEAIQSVPADAVIDSWGVTLSGDTITSAP
ncbi:MAG: hypothetical protein IJ412_05085 [Oscillospiraceae bacterium]|nr:hypothetical protein [Oscillospiraceae bacterium]